MIKVLDSAVAPDVPPGTILTFAGDCTNHSVLIALGKAGWMACDGTALSRNDYAELFEAIGISHGGELDSDGNVVRFNLPNLIGCLPRGVNGSAFDPITGKTYDPDTNTRVAAAPNGNTGNAVGSFQSYATARPVQTPLTLGNAGAHTHQANHLTDNNHKSYNGNNVDMSKYNKGSVGVPSAGSHHHTITDGGDAETLPASIALFHIIKYT